ncbi:MAG TPA: tRNA 2-thiouridine(34) synthase MnmA [Candidatus Eisenbacteria bacterium]|nr:tRNA 2-thiouridine(34) synthase MnmA [Candidatus Eisenbacteria bacterium]
MRVLVALSGGVDSAAAAAVLVAAGHDVTGATLKLWCYGGAEASPRSCCSLRDIEDARDAASTLGIPHYVLDEASQFDAEVVTPFVTSYLNGETPNPCVRCNTHLKFGSLLGRARRLGFDAVATGHYALRTDTPSGPVLRRARDRAKDQSYVLWGISREDLACSLFPLGELTKSEARETARRAGLRLAEKVESQDICFVQGGAYSEFVAARAPDAVSGKPGELVDTEGRVVGQHRGALHYTVGQRRGLGVAVGEPLYVVGVDATQNRVVVGREADLLAKSCTVREVNWVSCDPPTEPLEARVKIRYRAQPALAVLEPLPGSRVRASFQEPVRAVAPGQSAVFYREDVLLGGGIIEPGRVETGLKTE